MWGIPKIVLERLKRSTFDIRGNRQSAFKDRPSEHPDANLLTAFVERTLTERERRQVLSHLAECAECREIAALTLPAQVEAAEPIRLPVRSGWSVLPVLRWGALAAALGAVVVLAILHQHSRSRPQTASNNPPSTIVASAPETTREAPAALRAQPTSPAATRSARAKSLEPEGERPKLQESMAAPQARQDATRSQSFEMRALAPPRAPLPPPVASPVLPRFTQSAAVSTGADTNLISRAVQPSAAADRSPVPILNKKSPANGVGGSMAMRAKAAQAKLQGTAFRGQLENAALQPSPLWTISPEGRLQRSEDGGKNWEDVHVDDKVELRVVQTNGREIWAGGTAGALYHSSDGGVTWMRIDLASAGVPTTEAIVEINCSSSDLQRITLKTASGKLWVSDDGGQHWRAVTSDE